MDAILEDIVSKYGDEDKALVLNAYALAEKALEGRLRGNRKPFIEHPVHVAEIVSREIGLRADAVAAVFIHEATRFCGNTAAEAEKALKAVAGYPSDIIDMARGLNSISFITLQQTGLDGEKYRKLIVSYSTDPRVVLIKIADRLEVLRSIELLPPSKRSPKITESLLLYSPLAHQLGLYQIKSEMEDIFLRYMEPEQYRAITNHLKVTEKDREALATRFIGPLKEKLNRNGIKYTLKARTKSAYSIWKKMQAQKVPFEKIYDVFAMRFIIDCPAVRETEHELCWKVYSLVTEEYQPDTSRLRDWLSKPKENGYESLHTTVTTKEGTTVEVQIRTVRMDFEAEQGHASHWSYKGVKSEEVLNEWLSRVRSTIQDGTYASAAQLPDNLLNQVFVFTPAGDLRELRAGATVLDFAFNIHSNVGRRCTGARINGKIVPIREVLHTGEVVEILTSKNQKPNSDWLNFVVTSKARTKIRQILKEDQDKAGAIGKEALDRRLRNWKLELEDSMLAELVKKLGFKTINEFFAAIGNDGIDITDIKEYILQEREKAAAAKAAESQRQEHYQAKEVVSGDLVFEGGLGKVSYKMAKCCNPVPGDDIFGFITIKEGLKIHRMSCPNAARLINDYPYRVQKVRWKKK